MTGTKEVAAWLANADGKGASDVEFAEAIVLAYKMWNTGNPDAELDRTDMVECDTGKIAGKLKIILDEIIFDDDTDGSAWWKPVDQTAGGIR